MKKEKIDIYPVLYERVFVRVIMPMLLEMFLEKKQLMNSFQLTEYLRENIDDFLNADEKKQFIKPQFPVTENYSDETINNDAFLKISLLMFSSQMIENITQIINSKKFAGDNPHDPIKNPQMFMMWKFYDEKMGVKLNTMEGSGNAVDS